MQGKLLLVLFLGILNFACFSSFICENTVEKEIFSPNGNLKAVIFDRGCGATVGFITGISIISASEKIENNDSGNILFAEKIYREFSYNNGQTQYGKTNFDVEWINDGELKVFYTESKRLSKADKFGDIKIKYELISK